MISPVITPRPPPAPPRPPSIPLADGRTAIRPRRALPGAARRRAPVWFMRQAGRSLPEYRELRVGTRMLDACLDPDAGRARSRCSRCAATASTRASSSATSSCRSSSRASASTSSPGRGPVLEQADAHGGRRRRAAPLDPAALAPIAEAVARTVAELGEHPLIGFAGAPFTLAAYLVEGGPSKDHIRARALMHADPEAWEAPCSLGGRVTGASCARRCSPGASAAQLFDSWVGACRWPTTRSTSPRLLALARDLVARSRADLDVPLVHFGVGSGEVLSAMHDVGRRRGGRRLAHPARRGVAAARRRRARPGQHRPGDAAGAVAGARGARPRRARARQGAPAHVLNLGHGVPPETDPTVLTRIVGPRP